MNLAKTLLSAAALAASIAGTPAALAAPVDTTFTYQGELELNGVPVDGTANLEFRLYDAALGGVQVGPTLTANSFPVADGRFTIDLDFGDTVFDDGEERWLQVRVDGNTLTPRQSINAAPFAARARNGWDRSGNVLSYSSGFVGVGRSSSVTGAESFGIYRNTSGYGGMYIQTNDGGLPFYGYSTIGGPNVWHEYNDGAEQWRLYLSGVRMAVNRTDGHVGIGTTSPASQLHVAGDAGLTLGDTAGAHMVLDGQVGGETRIELFNDLGNNTVFVDTDSDNNGRILLRNQDGASRLAMVHELGTGGAHGALYAYNGAGVVTVEIDADWANSGAGRIRTSEIEITGGSDLSEHFDIRCPSGAEPTPGMVVCIDPERPGELIVASDAHDKTVAGIISGAGGVKPGMLMGQSGSEADGRLPVALTGRVYVWCDASSGAIHPGDMLTTSDVLGHAMKVTDHDAARGAVIGKAMTSLEEGRGLVLVLVTLQ